MQNFIIRIYRRTDGNPVELTGVVEEVGMDDKKVFSSADELWEILSEYKGSESEI